MWIPRIDSITNVCQIADVWSQLHCTVPPSQIRNVLERRSSVILKPFWAEWEISSNLTALSRENEPRKLNQIVWWNRWIFRRSQWHCREIIECFFYLAPFNIWNLIIIIIIHFSLQSREYHAHISNPKETCRVKKKTTKKAPKKPAGNDTKTKKDSGMSYNVAMVMLDAQSRANLYRQMPRLMQILHRHSNDGTSDDDVIIFKNHGVHGDGTTCQVC